MILVVSKFLQWFCPIVNTLDKTNQNYQWNFLRSFDSPSLPIWIRERHINFDAIIKQTFGICTIHFLIILVWEESKQWKCPPLFLYIPHNGHGFKTIKLEFVLFSAFVILYFTTSNALLNKLSSIKWQLPSISLLTISF